MTRVAFPGVEASQRALSVLWLLSVILLVLAANAYWYRATSLGGPHAALVRTEILGVSLFTFAGAAWLLTVARRRAIDRLRREQTAERKYIELGRQLTAEQAQVLAAADDAKLKGTEIFTVGLGDPDDIVAFEWLLRRVATDADMYYYAPDGEDLALIYRAIARLLPCPGVEPWPPGFRPAGSEVSP